MTAKIYTIQVTQKMCDQILRTNHNLATKIPGTSNSFYIHRNLHAAENGYGPFEIKVAFISELINPRWKNCNQGLYKSNNVVELPKNCEKFGIHESPTTRTFFTNFSAVLENEDHHHSFMIVGDEALPVN